MKKKIVPFALFVITACFLLFEIWTEGEIASLVNRDLYVIRLENQAFHRSDMEIMLNYGYDFSQYGEEILEVETRRSKQDTTVIATNENWEYIVREKMIQGSWFNHMQIQQKLPAAVINRQAAIQFFGTGNVLKNKFAVDGKEYTVTGIVDDRMEKPQIYISYENMLAYHKPDFEISQIWVLLKNHSEERLLLTRLGYLAEEAETFNMRDYQEVIDTRGKGMLFLTGLFFTLKLSALFAEQWKRFSAEIKVFLEDHYLIQSCKLLQRRNIQKYIGGMAGSVVIIYFIGKITWFVPSVPGVEYTQGCKGILEWIKKILIYYIQPKMTVSKYVILDEWNVLSVVISCAFLMCAFAFLVWRRQENKGKEQKVLCKSF